MAMATDAAITPQQPVIPQSSNPGENSINPSDNFLRFPPFPQPPIGVEVMPFKSFNERGICVNPGPDDAEVDVLGIPTVPLKPVHANDQCKTNTKRKRKAEENKARKKAGGTVTKAPWWEQWEETEVVRFSIGFDRNSTPQERIDAASTDFTSGRVWPTHYSSESGAKFIWEKFLRYIGLSNGNAAPPSKKSKKSMVQNDEPEDGEISDDETLEVNGEEPAHVNGVVSDNVDGVVMDRDMSVVKQMAANEEKLDNFLTSPEKSFRIFMTSYARAKGYIWADANLDCIPRVLRFFVEFLLRSKVLPELERNLRRSLDVINIAMKELPATSFIAKAMPDILSQACTACWGSKADRYQILTLDDDEGPEWDFLKAKKGDNTDTNANDTPKDKVEILPSDGSWNAPADSHWASNGEAWGPSVDGAAAAESNDINMESVSNDAAMESVWDEFKEPSLMTLLGPTAFPLTHTTGIVERSMCRIKSITEPPSNPPKAPPLPEGENGPDASAVELDLEAKFTKIVLEPMIDWDGGELPIYTRPQILKSSIGAVVDASQAGNDIPAAAGVPKAHDPLKDEITLLIETNSVNISHFSEGMGIGGTFVQIVRQAEFANKKRKGKGKSKKTIPNYWYLDEMAVIVPSFWSVDSS